jgi:hypothetical protein
MTEIESEWIGLQKNLRSFAEKGASEYKCLPSIGDELEAVWRGVCAAELKKSGSLLSVAQAQVRYGVVIGRLRSTNVSDGPPNLTWRLEPRQQNGRFVWYVDRLDKTLTTDELSQRILIQLKVYCEGYEEQLRKDG